MNAIAICLALEAEEEKKIPVIKLKNPRWDGWAVYRSWGDLHEVLGDFLEETWDREVEYMDSKFRLPPLTDSYEIEMDYMSEAEIAALMPLDY